MPEKNTREPPKATKSKKKKTAQATGPSRRSSNLKRSTGRQTPRTSKAWRAWMPERFESFDMVRKTLSRLDETRGALEFGEAIERLRLAAEEVNQRFQAMEQKTRTQASMQVGELRETILKIPALDAVHALPDRAWESLDEALERVGLIRKAKHELVVEDAKRKAERALLRKIRRAKKAKEAKSVERSTGE